MAALVIVVVVVGSILQHSGLTLGPLGVKPAPALTSKTFSLQAAQGTLSCPSTPVWSPDGKQLAVVALAQVSPGGCGQYNDVTNIQRSDTPGSNGVTESGPPPDTFAIIIFDAASGHVTRTITLPELTSSVLCAGVDPCSFGSASLQSVGWSPDGRRVAAFFTYTFFNDITHFQHHGLLITAPADGSVAPHAMIANGRTLLDFTSHPIGLDNIYSAPRFIWDLSKGTATANDIQRGEYPVPFAAGYHLGADGALTIDQQPQPGDATPWRTGVFNLFGPQGKLPWVSYQTSQWVWSADSRYVLPNLDTAAYLSIAGVTATPPSDNSGLIPRPTLLTTDAATTQTLKAAAQAASQAGLARNPGGKLLAALSCSPGGAGLLAIRSVATGKTLAQISYSYPLTSTSLGCAGDLGPIAWSPDGARIAATDGPDGQIIVWQAHVQA